MLERVTAGEALYRVVNSLTDRRPLDEILDEILEQVRAMLDAAESYILLRVDNQLVLRASSGLEIGPAGRRYFSVDEGIEGLVARGGEAVTAPALRHDPHFVDPFDRPAPIGSMLAVPLNLRGRVLGVLVGTRHQAGRFAGVEGWWLEVFGGLVASLIASDNAYHAQERRASQAETLLALSTLDEVPPIPHGVLGEIAKAFGTDRCGVLLLDETGQTLHFTGYDRHAVDLASGPAVALEATGALAVVIREGLTRSAVEVENDPVLSQLWFLQGVQGITAAPIPVGGKARGALYVAIGTPGWLEGDESFLQIVAARLGLQIERTELRQRQREMEREQAQMSARQEFLGIVSHDLKTPVAVMKAYAELLFRRAERAGRTEEMDVLRRMTDQAERMLAMIEQLLDLRRLEAGLLALEISHFDLAEVVRRIAHDVQLTTVSHNIIVEADRTVIRADRRRIEEVVVNLLDNARKYSPAGGRIWVRVHPDLLQPSGRQSVILSVSDEGPGIPASERERIFERFYQGAGRLHKGRAGLGIGLYVSRELVRRHGGEIWASSEEGHGATFIVRLPVEGPPSAD